MRAVGDLNEHLDMLDRDARCAKCGYSVRGLPSAICPECGTDLRGAASVVLLATTDWWGMARRLAANALVLGLLTGLAVLVISLSLPVTVCITQRVVVKPPESVPFTHLEISASGRETRLKYLGARLQEFSNATIYLRNTDLVSQLDLSFVFPAQGWSQLFDESRTYHSLGREKLREWVVDAIGKPAAFESEAWWDCVWETVTQTRTEIPIEYIRQNPIEYDEEPRRITFPDYPLLDAYSVRITLVLSVLLLVCCSIGILWRHRHVKTSLS